MTAGLDTGASRYVEAQPAKRTQSNGEDRYSKTPRQVLHTEGTCVGQSRDSPGEMTAATFSSNTQHEALSLVPAGSEHLWAQAIQVPIPEPEHCSLDQISPD